MARKAFRDCPDCATEVHARRLKCQQCGFEFKKSSKEEDVALSSPKMITVQCGCGLNVEGTERDIEDRLRTHKSVKASIMAKRGTHKEGTLGANLESTFIELGECS